MQALLPKLGCPSLAAAAAARARSIRFPPAILRHQNIAITCMAYPLIEGLAGHSLRAVATHATASDQQQQQQEQHLAAEDAFYAEEAHSFVELGLTPTLADAMRTAGFSRPSRVQELVIPKVLTGKDIVLAAETGSGKTLAYIAPLASLLLQKAASGQLPPSAETISDSSSSSSSSSSRKSSGYKPKPRPQPRWMGLVLCPNTALCHQVVRLVTSLQNPDTQEPLLRACHVSGSNPPPFEPPDIVVATPGALKTLFNDRGAMYGSQWTAEAVALRSAFVVVDEADLLWQGGYVKDLTRVLDAFKAAERRMLEAQVLQELDLDRSALDKLPRKVKEAMWKGGVPAMIGAGLTQTQIQRLRSEQQQQQQQQQGAVSAALQEEQQQQGQNDSMDASSSSSSSSAQDAERINSSSGASTSTSSSSSSSAEYGPYFKRQHLFVAATMPALTKGDVGTELQKRFPAALWVSGDMLHQVKPHVDHTWVRLKGDDDESSVNEALLAAIQADPDYQAGRARVLLFTRNTVNADRVSEFLTEQGVTNWVYHKNRPVKDQVDALSAMSQPNPDTNLVMVSTDAAARGIDLPQVTHVIQADFVANAIEYLHRVGRTARAGKSGKVTSLYGPADAVLAEAVRQYVEAGEPVADCFSRNRGFRRKVKRYGKFVPRGQGGRSSM